MDAKEHMDRNGNVWGGVDPSPYPHDEESFTGNVEPQSPLPEHYTAEHFDRILPIKKWVMVHSLKLLTAIERNDHASRTNT